MPEMTTSGGFPRRSSTANTTQSAGVPLVAQAGTPVSARSTRVALSGLCSVMEWLAALRSCSGATTEVSATEQTARASARSPGEVIPSSLVSRTRMVGRPPGPSPSRRPPARPPFPTTPEEALEPRGVAEHGHVVEHHVGRAAPDHGLKGPQVGQRVGLPRPAPPVEAQVPQLGGHGLRLERVDAVDEVQLPAEAPDQVRGPGPARFPGELEAAPVDPLEETPHPPDVGGLRREAGGALEQDEARPQRPRHVGRPLPGLPDLRGVGEPPVAVRPRLRDLEPRPAVGRDRGWVRDDLPRLERELEGRRDRGPPPRGRLHLGRLVERPLDLHDPEAPGVPGQGDGPPAAPDADVRRGPRHRISPRTPANAAYAGASKRASTTSARGLPARRCELISSSMARAACSTGNPPTPVPRAGKATERTPSDSATRRALRVADRMTGSLVRRSCPMVTAWIT